MSTPLPLPCCGNCRFWQPDERCGGCQPTSPREPLYQCDCQGGCHRYAPSPRAPGVALWTEWPETHSFDACGDWQPHPLRDQSEAFAATVLPIARGPGGSG